jgi:hypothetical protein
MPIQAINEQRRKSKLTLNNEIDVLQVQAKELYQLLKDNFIQLKEQNFSERTHTLKSKWYKRSGNENLSLAEQNLNEVTYQKIEGEKSKRSKMYNSIAGCKKELSTTRFEVYIRQKAILSGVVVPSTPTKVIDGIHSGLYRADDIQLAGNEKRNIFRNYACSGTDNGIVNMTESIPFPVDKFRYLIQLHNRYSILSEKVNSSEQILCHRKSLIYHLFHCQQLLQHILQILTLVVATGEAERRGKS